MTHNTQLTCHFTQGCLQHQGCHDTTTVTVIVKLVQERVVMQCYGDDQVEQCQLYIGTETIKLTVCGHAMQQTIKLIAGSHAMLWTIKLTVFGHAMLRTVKLPVCSHAMLQTVKLTVCSHIGPSTEMV